MRKKESFVANEIELRKLMTSHKLNQVSLSEKSGIGQSSISKILKGKPITKEVRERLSQAFGMNEDELVKVLTQGIYNTSSIKGGFHLEVSTSPLLDLWCDGTMNPGEFQLTFGSYKGKTYFSGDPQITTSENRALETVNRGNYEGFISNPHLIDTLSSVTPFPSRDLEDMIVNGDLDFAITSQKPTKELLSLGHFSSMYNSIGGIKLARVSPNIITPLSNSEWKTTLLKNPPYIIIYEDTSHGLQSYENLTLTSQMEACPAQTIANHIPMNSYMELMNKNINISIENDWEIFLLSDEIKLEWLRNLMRKNFVNLRLDDVLVEDIYPDGHMHYYDLNILVNKSLSSKKLEEVIGVIEKLRKDMEVKILNSQKSLENGIRIRQLNNAAYILGMSKEALVREIRRVRFSNSKLAVQ